MAERCAQCDGDGIIVISRGDKDGDDFETTTCPACGGSGEVDKDDG